MDALTDGTKPAGSRYQSAEYRARHREQARRQRARSRAAKLIRAKHRAWLRFMEMVACGTDVQIRLAWARYCDYADRLLRCTPPERITG